MSHAACPLSVSMPRFALRRALVQLRHLKLLALAGALVLGSTVGAAESVKHADTTTSVVAKPLATPKPAGAMPARPLSDTPEPEEYALWSQIISHGLEQGAQRVVLALKTSADLRAIVPPGAKLEEVAKRLETTPELLSRWVALNQEPAPLERNFTLSLPYVLLDERIRAELFRSPDPALGWRQFAAAYPGAPGLLRLSRAALDDAGQNALVYVEFHCGARCGSGRLIRAQMGAKGWQLLSGELIWVTGP